MKDRQSLGDTPPEEFRKQLHELADWIADFRENIESLRVAPNEKPGAVRAQLPAQPPENGEPFEKILSDVDRLIVPGMVHWSHPMFLGYFGWTTTAPGILGEIITAPLNVNAMTWRTCPAATELETVVIDWLRQWLGLPDEFGGVVYDTASVGIMHALAVAREQAAPSTRKLGLTNRDLPRFRIYTSDQAHSAAEKAAIALGIGEENVRRVPSDNEFRMDISRLRETIAQDRQKGFQPLAVVATVGTTSSASVDPVPEIAKICREEKMWLHIDGAYGGGFAMLPEYEWVRNGWEMADSIVINPHKTLFVPLDFSVLYVRDLERLRRVFTLVPEVLRGDTIEGEKNYMDYGIQLGRRFRALKAWVIWRSLGRAGNRGASARTNPPGKPARRLDQNGQSIRARRAGQHGRRLSFAFGWDADEQKLDNLNSELVEQINASGRAYLTQTKLRGRTVMRIGLGNVLTTEEHLRKAWEMIRQTADGCEHRHAIACVPSGHSVRCFGSAGSETAGRAD